MNRFENMDTFIRVVETGSISAAADALGIAKSAVSRRLKELEAHLDAELFHRTTRRMNLTDTGRTFYHQSIRILADVLEAELAVSQAHGTLKGSLKVAVPSSFGVLHLGPAINDFLQQHPQIEFDLDFNDRQVDLMLEGFDLAIRIANLPDSSLIARRIAPVQHVFCASPDYLEKHGAPQTPAELSNHQCLVYNLLQDYQHWTLIDRNNQERKIKIHPRIKASAGEFLRDAAVNSQGIVYLPTFIVYREIETGALIPVLRDMRARQINAYAIYPHTRHLSLRVRAFVDFLVQRFAGIPYWDNCLENQPQNHDAHSAAQDR
ncbi:MAG: LysR family transcriptional regulator [Nitrosomonas sp.]|nr:LysR family transcriptional regulator [Nitrosomonas sp.]MCP5250335.1 LysR family transcriptional regulator [Burkholderiales bacterium]MCP5291999.1 LysR family transcriptional regulator [Burkholderiales bacterium]MDR4520300.1 LysR family transcriptional regulator [Nitrosomonas sp.]HQU63139.1 LysR family transcriptional regulator [Nitrosomonas sp.]